MINLIMMKAAQMTKYIIIGESILSLVNSPLEETLPLVPA